MTAAPSLCLLAVSIAASVLAARAAAAPPVRTSPTMRLKAYDVTITPNWLSPLDSPASNYQAVWIYPKSPTTPYRSPDSLHQRTRYLLLDPRYRDSDGRRGHDEWWFIIQRYWASAFRPDEHGNWGRQVNFHMV